MVLSLCALASLAPRAHAQARTPGLQSLIDAELAFARRNMEAGQKQSWLDYFAPDGVMFLASGPVNAREYMSGDPQPAPAPAGAFDWRPTFGGVARSGDLGFSAGPVKVAGAPRADLMFFSVWRRQPDGAWRVVADLGLPIALPDSVDPYGDPYVEAPQVASRGRGRVEDLLALDGTAREDADAFAALVDPGARGIRRREPVLTGPAAFRASMAARPGRLTHQPAGGGVSDAGDLGYSYGRFAVAAPTSQQGSYLRLWRRDAAGAWRILYDVMRPDAPPR